MPHFSRAKIKFRNNVIAADMDGEPVEYRGIAFLQFRTEWNETTRSFTPMTAEQKQTCEDLYRQLADAGVELGVTVTERTPGVQDVREFKKVLSFQLFVNKPDGSMSVAPAPAPGAPAPAAPQPNGDSNGW